MKINSSLLVFAIAFSSTVQAADPVPWDDLSHKLGPKLMQPGRHVQVVTHDGRTYSGSWLIVGPSVLTVGGSQPAIPREQAAEIRLKRYGKLSDAIYWPADKVICDGTSDMCGIFLLMGLWIPYLGVTAATAPLVLSIEGAKRLLPDRVIRVAP